MTTRQEHPPDTGRGYGPAYIEGPVTVIGHDIYRLDSDNDGIGCE